jgi:hypothetical protein
MQSLHNRQSSPRTLTNSLRALPDHDSCDRGCPCSHRS